MQHPQVIFFDAVGTLFGVRGTVGEIYGRFLEGVGLEVDVIALDQAFRQSFREAPRAAFPDTSAQDLLRLEYQWWRGVAQQSFAQVGVLDRLSNFDLFFQPLFDYFATAEPWVIYPEVVQMLSHLKTQGFELAIISNFDSRLDKALQALKLDRWFSSVTISTQVGAAKPEPAIFTAALTKLGYGPDQAWHVGDSWAEDYQGALAAGIQGVWLNRPENVYLKDAKSWDPDELALNQLDFVVQDLTGLGAILDAQS